MTEEPRDAEPASYAALAARWGAAAVDVPKSERDEAGFRWRFVDAPGAIVPKVAGAGLAAAVPARVAIGDEVARWASTAAAGEDDELQAALAALVEANGGMGDAVQTFYALHRERVGGVARERTGYETVRNQNRLMLEVAPSPADDVTVRQVDGWSDALAALLATPVPGEHAWRVRDGAWFEWRFLAHPARPYRLLVAERGGAAVGFCAARTETLSGERATWAVDWHVAGVDHGVSRTLAAAARGEGRLGWLLPDTVPEWIVLQELGARIEPTPWFLDVRTFSRRTTDRWLQQHWAYTLADFDLI